MFADWDKIGNAEHFSEIHPKDFKANEVEPVMLGESFRFPLAEGRLRQPGSNRHKNSSSRRKLAVQDAGGDPAQAAGGDPAQEEHEDNEEDEDNSRVLYKEEFRKYDD